MRQLLALLVSCFHFASSEKCYSCSSAQLHLRWPKDENNSLLYFHEFPWFANETCDQVKYMIPVVDCPNSVCIKAVIKEPPAKREVCVQGGAVVRDCWSRVMHLIEPEHSLNPNARKSIIKLSEDTSLERTVGLIYTCEGFLCNSSPALLSSFLPLLPLLLPHFH